MDDVTPLVLEPSGCREVCRLRGTYASMPVVEDAGPCAVMDDKVSPPMITSDSALTATAAKRGNDTNAV